MRALEFTAGLSKALGVEQSALQTVDRSLANEGLRQKSRGRATVEVSRLEAIRMIIGVAAASQLTQAAKDVFELEKFKLMDGQNVDTAKAIGITQRMTLFEAIGLVCEKLSRDQTPHGIWVSVEQGGAVTIQIQRDDVEDELRFHGALNTSGSNHGLQTVRTFTPQALAWVGRATQE